MTCIVGIIQDGKVYIGADSFAGDGYSRHLIATPKVFQVGEFLIGYTTSFRMGQILQYHLEVRPQQENESNDAYLVVAFVEAVRGVLKDKGYAKVESGTETGGTFLVGYRGTLCTVYDNFQVSQWTDGIATCGSAEQYALAAMVALPDLKPAERIRRALEISAELCGFVSAPFHVESI